MLGARLARRVSARVRLAGGGVLGWGLPGSGRAADAAQALRSPAPGARAWAALAAVALLAAGIVYEARTSALQSRALSRWAAALTYRTEPGPSPSVIFPRDGPFDVRRGYALLPEFRRRLEQAGWTVTEQARFSPALSRAVAWGIHPPYREPPASGLVLRGSGGETLYDARPSGQMLASFEDVPPLLLDALLFIENRQLARPSGPRRNPAVDWPRLARAGLLYAGRTVGLPVRLEGGSTLAVQMEKYRHSPEGRTAGALDKLRQIASASLDAYRSGPDTREASRQIVLDYLNTMPLGSAPGRGEVYGLGPGLRAWFGMELEEVLEALRETAVSEAKACAFKHVLALLCAVRAPSRYLAEDRAALERRVSSYESLLREAGVLDDALYRKVRAAPIRFAPPRARGGPAPSFAERKPVNAVRSDLVRLLGLPGAYELDRLDLEVDTTLDGDLQEEVHRLLRSLRDRDFLESNGLVAERLLASGDPAKVAYGVVLYERTPGGNALRVHADNIQQPFDAVRGMKLELGSTAKLRTLAHYLHVAASLHEELSRLGARELRRRELAARDPITRWAARALGERPRLGLEAFLEAALERTYSASPAEAFFTGGGVHTFRNFDPGDDRRVMTVRQAVVHSTNLVFVRLMRDLVRYHEARLSYDARRVLEDPEDPVRKRMLEEIAAEEAREALWRAYGRYRGLRTTGQILLRLLEEERVASPRSLSMVFFAWNPGSGPEQLHRFLRPRVPGITLEEARRLAQAYGDPRLTISDYGYLLDRHPLEVWCAGQLASDPDLGWDDLLARSEQARRTSSSWLFRTRNRRAQDLRLRIRIERDAFERMTPHWKALGFPFERLVPSYATAIGSSGDRPAALAELLGIVLNDGVRAPAGALRRLRFGAGTPYHTVFERLPKPGERVMRPEVARALRAVLADVVEEGTGRRVREVFRGPDGSAVPVGGKTGSGDNRYETFARGGGLLSSRPVSRTAAFAFTIGDRYYGVITASVEGEEAARYRFTSALPLQILKLLAPAINERLGGPGEKSGPALRASSPAAEGGDPAQARDDPGRPPRGAAAATESARGGGVRAVPEQSSIGTAGPAALGFEAAMLSSSSSVENDETGPSRWDPSLSPLRRLSPRATGASRRATTEAGWASETDPGYLPAGGSAWPPNLFRMADRSLSAKLCSSRERKRA